MSGGCRVSNTVQLKTILTLPPSKNSRVRVEGRIALFHQLNAAMIDIHTLRVAVDSALDIMILSQNISQLFVQIVRNCCHPRGILIRFLILMSRTYIEVQ